MSGPLPRLQKYRNKQKKPACTWVVVADEWRVMFILIIIGNLRCSSPLLVSTKASTPPFPLSALHFDKNRIWADYSFRAMPVLWRFHLSLNVGRNKRRWWSITFNECLPSSCASRHTQKVWSDGVPESTTHWADCLVRQHPHKYMDCYRVLPSPRLVFYSPQHDHSQVEGAFPMWEKNYRDKTANVLMKVSCFITDSKACVWAIFSWGPASCLVHFTPNHQLVHGTNFPWPLVTVKKTLHKVEDGGSRSASWRVWTWNNTLRWVEKAIYWRLQVATGDEQEEWSRSGRGLSCSLWSLQWASADLNHLGRQYNPL